MKWAIGLDLRREGKGALNFVRWLRERSADDDFTALHVLETSPLLQALRSAEESVDAVELAREAGTEELASAGLGDVEGPVVLDGDLADDALADELSKLGAEGLIIGRRAETKDTRWRRLGPIARRLLTRLPAPIVVVPPDLSLETIGDGPILVATDLRDDSVGAAWFAKRVADTYGCDVATIHVVPGSSASEMFVPAATLQQLYEQVGLDRKKSLERWKADAGLPDAPAVIASGDVVARVLGVAENERATMIVTGSRLTSTVARIFTASVGTSLASYAPCPVAVVPPP